MQEDFDKIWRNMKLELEKSKKKEQIAGRHLAGIEKGWVMVTSEGTSWPR
jgi:hypothetical protein